MADLSIKVSTFEGPLDLLLHLIEKDKIDIYDIPIVSVTEQYLAYLSAMEEFDMETASEFLLMAATLLQIKSRMLLPAEETQPDGEEEDPRHHLTEMLLAYRKIKQSAAALAQMKAQTGTMLGRQPLFAVVQYVWPQYRAEDLLRAYAGIGGAAVEETVFIEPATYSVRQKMSDILALLAARQGGFALQEIFLAGNRGEQVAAFLALLELLKLGAVVISQAQRFAPIYIFAGQGEHEHVL